MSSQHLSLLFVIKALGLPGGGAERVLSEVASQLARRGHSVRILTFDPAGAEPFYPLNPAVRLDRLGIGDARAHIGPVQFFRQLRALRRRAIDQGPDVAVGFMHSSYVALAFALAGSRVPVVASEHISFDHYQTRPVQRRLMRAAAAISSGITAVSERVRQGFPASIRRKMVVVPNPVGQPAKAMRRPANSSKSHILLSVGRLEEQKDHRTLIAAFASIAHKFPDWKLRIVGGGSLGPQLKSQVADLVMGARIALPGAVSNIGKEYAQASLFAMPSLYESFGLATAEALATGIPAIGFGDCPGTNEVIENGVNGLLVEGSDRVKALADGLGRLMDSQGLRARMGEAGPASVERYSLESVVDRWEQMLGSVARPNRQGRIIVSTHADQLQRNIAVHNRVAGKYEALHGEIFNDIEQARLRDLLARALALVATDGEPVRALDFGCGSGNLTGHLLHLGARVTAADVAEGFLQLVRNRNPSEKLETFQLNGRDLSEVADGSFGLVATYSVLHHIPDYLGACAELARVTRPGGAIVIDHEASPGSWSGDATYKQFRGEALRFDWRKYASPMNYVHRFRRIFNPRHSNEGDIHVWPDDHIEWDKIDAVMRQGGLEVAIVEDYLLNRSLYRPKVHDRYRQRCSDTRATVYRKVD